MQILGIQRTLNCQSNFNEKRILEILYVISKLTDLAYDIWTNTAEQRPEADPHMICQLEYQSVLWGKDYYVSTQCQEMDSLIGRKVLGNGQPNREKTSTSVIPLCHACMYAKSFQWCMTLCDTMDCSPPGSSVHGILQARILEWVAMPSSRGSSRPRQSLPLSHWGSPPSPYIIFRN